jgi:Sulfotransferase domain
MADVKMWYEAAEAKFFRMLGVPNPPDRAEFDQLLRVNAAVYDAKFIAFASELIEAYHDIVVIVERDIEAGYKSFDSAIRVNQSVQSRPQAIANLGVWFLYQISRTMKLILRGH